jgi:hypothetical protein
MDKKKGVTFAENVKISLLNRFNMKTLDYNDAIKHISGFLEISGIRDFCRTKCNGRCCRKCDKGQNGQIKCSDKLTCATWLCAEMSREIRKVEGGNKFYNEWKIAEQKIFSVVDKRMQLVLGYSFSKSYYRDYSNIYYVGLEFKLPRYPKGIKDIKMPRLNTIYGI